LRKSKLIQDLALKAFLRYLLIVHPLLSIEREKLNIQTSICFGTCYGPIPINQGLLLGQMSQAQDIEEYNARKKGLSKDEWQQQREAITEFQMDQSLHLVTGVKDVEFAEYIKQRVRSGDSEDAVELSELFKQMSPVQSLQVLRNTFLDIYPKLESMRVQSRSATPKERL
jgi:hypothetical protein